MKKVYDVVKKALVRRGWEIDKLSTPNPSDELQEFVHPFTRKRLAWIDALLAQAELEVDSRSSKESLLPRWLRVGATVDYSTKEAATLLNRSPKAKVMGFSADKQEVKLRFSNGSEIITSVKDLIAAKDRV